jgi:hypothetical protein
VVNAERSGKRQALIRNLGMFDPMGNRFPLITISYFQENLVKQPRKKSMNSMDSHFPLPISCSQVNDS